MDPTAQAPVTKPEQATVTADLPSLRAAEPSTEPGVSGAQ